MHPGNEHHLRHDGHDEMGIMPIGHDIDHMSHGCARQEFDCGAEQQVVKHQHVVKHRRDIINEYDVIHEYDINHYDVVKHRDVVRTNDFRSHQPNYCNNDSCCCNDGHHRPRPGRGVRRRFW